MLDDSFAHLKREIEPRKIQVTLLELLDDPQGMQIVIEAAAVPPHQFIELALPSVSERWMADVMHQRQRLGELGVQAKGGGNGASDLPHLQRVGKPIAKVIGEALGENLRFSFEASKCSRMNDAVAIARVFAAVSVGLLGDTPSARIRRRNRPRR
jgi:hypothetical protein